MTVACSALFRRAVAYSVRRFQILYAPGAVCMNLQRLVAKLLRTKSQPISRLLPLNLSTSVDNLVTALAKTLLSTAANQAPPTERKQGSRISWATQEANAGMRSKWQERVNARKQATTCCTEQPDPAQSSKGGRQPAQTSMLAATPVKRFFES